MTSFDVPKLNAPKEIESRLRLALEAVASAEKVILSHYQNPDLIVEYKSNQTVVTLADREAEKTIRQMIASQFPEDGILGEELSQVTGQSGFDWILDPIDGTQSFVCGVPLFGTMIGITRQGQPTVGVIHLPALDETYFGVRGDGAWWRSRGSSVLRRAHVSTTETLKQSLFITTSHSGFERIQRGQLFHQLLQVTKKFRGWGSCYGHVLVATGRADFMVDPDISVWDCAAVEPIVREAGGHFFDLSGQPTIYGGSAISVNANLEAELRAVLKAH